jgi:3-hydroxybutyrate dehydrogenase
LAGSGITANCINPGWVKTDLVNAQIAKRAEEMKVSFEEATDIILREKQPSRQFINVEVKKGFFFFFFMNDFHFFLFLFSFQQDISNMILFLCSPSGHQMTASCYLLDGGWTAQ